MTADPVPTFAELFRGRTDALGLNKGGVRKREVTREDYARHLNGETPIGIFPLLDSAHVWFGAIDLDEPNFLLAKQMQKLVPGYSFIEQSRSGNAHVWAFFSKPAPAWAVRTVLRGATEAVGRKDVEIFPKQDGLKPGMVGNYINLPYFGRERPFVAVQDGTGDTVPYEPHYSLDRAWQARQDPTVWEGRARLLGGQPPSERGPAREFGTQKYLHDCADHIIVNRFDNPVMPGHRNVVLFNLAKMLLNWEAMTPFEARQAVDLVNEASPQPLSESAVDTLFENAAERGYTSTGCDDPVMAPYVRPDCPIANGKVGR